MNRNREEAEKFWNVIAENREQAFNQILNKMNVNDLHRMKDEMQIMKQKHDYLFETDIQRIESRLKELSASPRSNLRKKL